MNLCKCYTDLDRCISISSETRNDSWHNQIVGLLSKFEASKEYENDFSKRKEIIVAARSQIAQYEQKHGLNPQTACPSQAMTSVATSFPHSQPVPSKYLTKSAENKDTAVDQSRVDDVLHPFSSGNIREDLVRKSDASKFDVQVNETQQDTLNQMRSENEMLRAKSETLQVDCSHLAMKLDDIIAESNQQKVINEKMREELALAVDNLKKTQCDLYDARTKNHALSAKIDCLHEGNVSLAAKLKETDREKVKYKMLVRENYECFVQEEALRILNIQPETLGQDDNRPKYPALLAYLRLVFSDESTFVMAFQEFDAALSKLCGLSDFMPLRHQAEKAINERFAESGLTVTWDLRGKPYDRDLYHSESDSGNIVASVQKALIKKNGNVVVKAYVTTDY